MAEIRLSHYGKGASAHRRWLTKQELFDVDPQPTSTSTLSISGQFDAIKPTWSQCALGALDRVSWANMSIAKYRCSNHITVRCRSRTRLQQCKSNPEGAGKR